jgi:hypothetical protein
MKYLICGVILGIAGCFFVMSLIKGSDKKGTPDTSINKSIPVRQEGAQRRAVSNPTKIEEIPKSEDLSTRRIGANVLAAAGAQVLFYGSSDLSPDLVKSLKLTEHQSAQINQEISKTLLELRRLEENHASLRVDSSGDEVIEIRPYDGSEYAAQLTSSIKNIAGDEVGTFLTDALLSNDLLAGFGKFTQKIWVEPISSNLTDKSLIPLLFHQHFIDSNGRQIKHNPTMMPPKFYSEQYGGMIEKLKKSP